MNKIDLYTDGACSGNPGIGGWGCILVYKNIRKEFSGVVLDTTNNRMELLAVIKGFEALKKTCIINVYSDSAYVVNAFNLGWVENWEKNNWKSSDKKEVKNIDLWIRLINLVKSHKSVNWIKVKGHSDNELNNRCDELATSQIKAYKKTSS